MTIREMEMNGASQIKQHACKKPNPFLIKKWRGIYTAKITVFESDTTTKTIINFFGQTFEEVEDKINEYIGIL